MKRLAVEMSFREIDRKSVVDEIIDQVVWTIRSHALKPGDRLPSEAELVDQLGVGRSSIREALKALEVLGIVKRTHAGTVIAGSQGLEAVARFLAINFASKRLQITHVYEARRILEVELAVLAGGNAQEEDILHLRDLTSEMERFDVSEIRKYAEVDRAFHQYIANLANNEILTRMWEIAYELFLAIRLSVSVSAEFLQASNYRHALLVDAIEVGDAQLLRQTMIESLQLGELDLETQLERVSGVAI